MPKSEEFGDLYRTPNTKQINTRSRMPSAVSHAGYSLLQGSRQPTAAAHVGYSLLQIQPTKAVLGALGVPRRTNGCAPPVTCPRLSPAPLPYGLGRRLGSMPKIKMIHAKNQDPCQNRKSSATSLEHQTPNRSILAVACRAPSSVSDAMHRQNNRTQAAPAIARISRL